MENEQESIAISEFKATCLKVLERVKKTGNSVLVTRRGDPIAVVTPPPLPQKKESWLGMYKIEGKIIGDILEPVIDDSDWEVLSQ
jgi:prevent-host-death family protein